MSPINDDGDKLTGTVEVDETYVGGRPRGRRRWIKGTTQRNKRGISSKQPVLAAVARETGQVKVRVIPDVKANTLKQAVNELVDKSANLVTDELRAYFRIGRQYASHRHVKHALGEYVRGDVTTNTIEGFFSILKRGIFGVYHNVSRKHLQRYVDEFEFRYNNRELEDGERTVVAIQGAVGKRLMYRDPLTA